MINIQILVVIYMLIFIVILLILLAIFQIKMAGMKVKDFWSFIEANQNLEKLYNFSKAYEKMTPQQQIVFLMQAEKIFRAFDKVPNILWEEEYPKYEAVLDTYKDIKILRWVSSKN